MPAVGTLADTSSVGIYSGAERGGPTRFGHTHDVSNPVDICSCGWSSKFRGAKLTSVFGQSAFAADLIYFAAIMFVKLSMLILYIRVFTESRKFRRTAQALMAVIIISHVAIIFVQLFQRDRMDCNWRYLEPDIDCRDRVDVDTLLILLTFISVLTVVLDVIILALPCPAVWKLHLPRPQKLAILITIISGVV